MRHFDREVRNRRGFLASVGAAVIPLARSIYAAGASPKQAPPKDLVADWQTCKDVTLEFAQVMPADYYGFKPTPAVRSFAEQMLHIAQQNMLMVAQAVKNEKPPITDFTPEAAQGKAAVMRLLAQSFDYVLAAARGLSAQDGEQIVSLLQQRMPKWKVFYFARDHTTHHRGQTVVYLRLKGIVPPEYRF